jgi:hypothetical protein
MPSWFMLAGNEPDKLKKSFNDFYASRGLPRGIALWKWKNSYWICCPTKNKPDILTSFANFRVIEFASAPSPSDIEFIGGDNDSLTVAL